MVLRICSSSVSAASCVRVLFHLSTECFFTKTTTTCIITSTITYISWDNSNQSNSYGLLPVSLVLPTATNTPTATTPNTMPTMAPVLRPPPPPPLHRSSVTRSTDSEPPLYVSSPDKEVGLHSAPSYVEPVSQVTMHTRWLSNQ